MSKRHFFPILGPPKRIFKFHPLFVHPRPRKTWKPQHPEGFSKRSAVPPCDGIAGFKRLRATAGQGPKYVGTFCGYVGLCWRMLAYRAGNVGPILWLCWPMLASCWPMLSQKIRKMGTAKKHCKTHDILMVGGRSWGYVGPSWGYAGPSWGQCWPIFGLCWPILGLCWPILELCWPILALCWPILGLCWPILRPMLAHLEAYVGPCWPIWNHKIRKMGKKGKSTKHRKTRDFLAVPGGSPAGGAAPLSYGEERNAFGNATARCHFLLKRRRLSSDLENLLVAFRRWGHACHFGCQLNYSWTGLQI